MSEFWSAVDMVGVWAFRILVLFALLLGVISLVGGLQKGVTAAIRALRNG